MPDPLRSPSARSARGAMTLPGKYFTSEAIFAEEHRRIFSEHWLFTGHVSQLGRPGDYYLFSLGHESVIVVRDTGGEVRAFFNVCRHRGSRLCAETAGNFPRTIQCPYHAWTYELDGRLKAAPTLHEREDFDKADYPLHPAALAVWEGLVFVNLSPEPQPFEPVFAPLVGKFERWRIAELRSVEQTVYTVEANWKLFFQNYNECLHCPTVHPALNRLTPFRNSSNDLDEGPFLGGPMKLSAPAASMTMDGARCAPPLPGVSGDDLTLVHYYTIFPNIFLSLHPDYVLVHRSEPLAPSRTRIFCDWYFHPDAIAAPGFDPRGAVEFWDMTNRQDWELCSISQQGVSSRAYTPGPYSELESQLAAFDREYLRVMERSGR